MQILVDSFSGSDLLQDNRLFNAMKGLCRLAQKEEGPASENYIVDDWENHYQSLFYVLFREKRFQNPGGQFHLLWMDGRPVAFGGAYMQGGVGICLCRAYTHPKFRGKQILGKYILPAQEEFVVNQGGEEAWLTFNSYNDTIFKALSRVSEGASINLGVETAESYLGYRPVSEPQMIQYTLQKVMTKKLR